MIYPAPSYLSEFVTEVNEPILLEIQKEYGDHSTAFIFNTYFTQLVQTWVEEYQNYGGTIWGVDDENKKITIFNPFKNGYNGVMEINEEEDITSTKNIVLAKDTAIIIAFQYDGEEAAYIEDGLSKFAQDYFGWVIVYTYVDHKLKELLSYECT